MRLSLCTLEERMAKQLLCRWPLGCILLQACVNHIFEDFAEWMGVSFNVQGGRFFRHCLHQYLRRGV